MDFEDALSFIHVEDGALRSGATECTRDNQFRIAYGTNYTDGIVTLRDAWGYPIRLHEDGRRLVVDPNATPTQVRLQSVGDRFLQSGDAVRMYITQINGLRPVAGLPGRNWPLGQVIDLPIDEANDESIIPSALYTYRIHVVDSSNRSRRDIARHIRLVEDGRDLDRSELASRDCLMYRVEVARHPLLENIYLVAGLDVDAVAAWAEINEIMAEHVCGRAEASVFRPYDTPQQIFGPRFTEYLTLRSRLFLDSDTAFFLGPLLEEIYTNCRLPTAMTNHLAFDAVDDGQTSIEDLALGACSDFEEPGLPPGSREPIAPSQYGGLPADAASLVGLCLTEVWQGRVPANEQCLPVSDGDEDTEFPKTTVIPGVDQNCGVNGDTDCPTQLTVEQEDGSFTYTSINRDTNESLVVTYDEPSRSWTLRYFNGAGATFTFNATVKDGIATGRLDYVGEDGETRTNEVVVATQSIGPEIVRRANATADNVGAIFSAGVDVLGAVTAAAKGTGTGALVGELSEFVYQAFGAETVASLADPSPQGAARQAVVSFMGAVIARIRQNGIPLSSPNLQCSLTQPPEGGGPFGDQTTSDNPIIARIAELYAATAPFAQCFCENGGAQLVGAGTCPGQISETYHDMLCALNPFGPDGAPRPECRERIVELNTGDPGACSLMLCSMHGDAAGNNCCQQLDIDRLRFPPVSFEERNLCSQIQCGPDARCFCRDSGLCGCIPLGGEFDPPGGGIPWPTNPIP